MLKGDLVHLKMEEIPEVAHAYRYNEWLHVNKHKLFVIDNVLEYKGFPNSIILKKCPYVFTEKQLEKVGL